MNCPLPPPSLNMPLRISEPVLTSIFNLDCFLASPTQVTAEQSMQFAVRLFCNNNNWPLLFLLQTLIVKSRCEVLLSRKCKGILHIMSQAYLYFRMIFSRRFNKNLIHCMLSNTVVNVWLGLICVFLFWRSTLFV